MLHFFLEMGCNPAALMKSMRESWNFFGANGPASMTARTNGLDFPRIRMSEFPTSSNQAFSGCLKRKLGF
jgi:hypothetical protein